MKKIIYYLRVILPVIAGALVFGCAPQVRVSALAPQISAPPQASANEYAEHRSIGRLAVLEPEILLYDVSAGGILEYRDDWSRLASKSVMVTAAVKLSAMGYGVSVLPDAVHERDLFKLKTMIRYHGSAFQSAFFANMDIASEIDTLTYSVGPQDELCEAFGVDGFLYIYGFEEKFSLLRKEFAGQSQRERTFMVAMLVERGGRVSWYRHMLVSGNQDIRKEKDAARMIGAMFE